MQMLHSDRASEILSCNFIAVREIYRGFVSFYGCMGGWFCRISLAPLALSPYGRIFFIVFFR